MKKIFLIFMLIIGIFSINSMGNVAYAENINDDECYSYYVSEFETGLELFSKNKNEKHEIASMVKIMTLDLVFDEIDNGNLSLSDKVYISSNAESMGGSQLYLEEGSEYFVSDLIEGVVVCSANDASMALAEKVAGSEVEFVNLMNKKANLLGMYNTMFVNPTGLPSDKEQYSTAYDVNLMTRDLMKHKDYYLYTKIWNKDFTHANGRKIQMTNTNKLVRTYPYCICGKTGFTNNAGFCLSAGAEKDNLKIVSTLLGGSSSKIRFNKIAQLFNESFENYSRKVIFKSNEKINDIKVSKSCKDKVSVCAKEDVTILCKKNEELEKYTISYNNLSAPIKKNAKVGCIKVTSLCGEKEYSLYSMEDIEKKNFKDYIKDIIKN